MKQDFTDRDNINGINNNRNKMEMTMTTCCSNYSERKAFEEESTMLINKFDRALEEKELKLRTTLSDSSNNIMNDNVLKGLLESFESDIRLLQYDFLQNLELARSKYIGKYVMDTKVKMPGKSHLAETLATAAGAGGGLAASVLAVTTETSGILFWKKVTEVSLAGAIAKALGIPAGLATGGLVIVGGAVAGGIIYKVFKSKKRQKRIDDTVKIFREETEPQLKDWARRMAASAAAV